MEDGMNDSIKWAHDLMDGLDPDEVRTLRDAAAGKLRFMEALEMQER